MKSYSDAHAQPGKLYTDPVAWARRALIDIGCSGTFSSDRIVTEYEAEI